MRRIYPPKERIKLNGGINSQFDRALIADNESPDCKNVIFDNDSAQTREGYQKLNTTTVGSFVGDGLYTRRDNSGAQTMIAFFGGKMFQWNATTFVTTPSAQSVFTAGQRIAADMSENYIFFGDGGVNPYKWNGADFTRHGVYPPTTTSTVSSFATGTLTGAYRYKVTNVNSNLVESDVGPVTATFTAVSATLRVSSVPVAPVSFGINARRIYRTDSGGSSFKLLTTLNDNTTTIYDDNNPDTSLGAVAPTDQGVPPKFSAIIYHQNRLWMNDPANPNFVWYTELANPYVVKATNFIRVGDKSSDLVRGFGISDNSLAVFCDKSITLIYMPDTDPNNWQVTKSKSPYGTRSPRGIVGYANRILFPAMEGNVLIGFGSLEGTTLSQDASFLSTNAVGSDLSSFKLTNDLLTIPESLLNDITSYVFKGKAWVTVPFGSGALTTNRVYQMDFTNLEGIGDLSKPQKVTFVPFTGINAQQFTELDGKLYFSSSLANGFVYTAESGVYNDDGAAIDSYIWTKEFSGDPSEINSQKDFRFINALIENAGDWFMDVGYRVDSDKGVGNTTQVDLDPGGSLWGTMIWGTSMWGGGADERDARIFLGTLRGKRIQLKFSNQNKVNQRFKIIGANFHYNLKGYR